MKLVSTVLLFCSILFVVAADIIKPHPYQVWRAGTTQTVQIEGDFHEEDTIAIFFNEDRDALLAGGPASQKVFEVYVPWEAKSPAGKYSELVVVHRYQYYLNNVETVWVNVTTH
ncbi:hypothetical protein K450DRAFT_241648 [Umbelopsis ramanniana AG]|uniref:Uncharacterized protein n=1 Tax=Umbelopsis ramanniana AG TaxID=1314678 RepID=A0AAD5E924_UMBRA|nr:uncharacterized protein K450DRAFT_241648 [Umbelopsis ramanniana AG]KAI8579576.1 hypothetical protein K450DRAFT_241648 [Umbelopsis ramanniana AG]